MVLEGRNTPVKLPSSATDSHLSNEQLCSAKVWRRCNVARQRVAFCLKATLVKCRCLTAGKYSFSCSVLRALGCIVCMLHRTEVFHCRQTRCMCLWVSMPFLRTMPDKISLERCCQSACGGAEKRFSRLVCKAASCEQASKRLGHAST